MTKALPPLRLHALPGRPRATSLTTGRQPREHVRECSVPLPEAGCAFTSLASLLVLHANLTAAHFWRVHEIQPTLRRDPLALRPGVSAGLHRGRRRGQLYEATSWSTGVVRHRGVERRVDPRILHTTTLIFGDSRFD
jgi:hypothetical protein